MTFARPSARAVAATMIAAAIGVFAPACSSGGSESVRDTTAKVSDSAIAIDQTTTTAAGTSTTAASTAPAAPVGLPDQEAVATSLDAWVADDRVTAATVADPAAVDAMWQAAKGDYSLYNSCSTGEFDTSGCLFHGGPGTIQIDLEKQRQLGRRRCLLHAPLTRQRPGGPHPISGTRPDEPVVERLAPLVERRRQPGPARTCRRTTHPTSRTTTRTGWGE